MPRDPKLKATMHRFVSMLAQGDYEALEHLTNGIRLTATEIAESIRDYDDSLILPPDDVFENLDVIEVEDAQPKEWSVKVDLWTVKEGRSDLTLELTLRETGKEIYGVEVDNLHVV